MRVEALGEHAECRCTAREHQVVGCFLPRAKWTNSAPSVVQGVAVVGNEVRVGLVPGWKPEELQLTLHAALAEELFDRLLERVEATIPPERIELHGPHRFVVARAD
jgi:hypothetical protein